MRRPPGHASSAKPEDALSKRQIEQDNGLAGVPVFSLLKVQFEIQIGLE